MWLRIITIVVVGLLYSVCQNIIKAQSVSSSCLETSPSYLKDFDSIPPYVIVIEDSNQINIPDSLFYAIAGTSLFEGNKTILNTQSQLCRELKDKVLPLAREEGWKLEGIELRGSASPEGTYRNNQLLAHNRAMALYNFMAQYLSPEATENTTISTIPEDYDYLVWLLQKNKDNDAAAVARIVNYCKGDPIMIKPALKKERGGILWNRLLKEYYPFLRYARVVVYFTHTLPDSSSDNNSSELIFHYPVESLLPMPDITSRQSIEIQWIGTRWEERSHLLSLSSNLLYDLFYMPHFGFAPMLNINLEYYPGKGNFTYRAGFTSPYYHKKQSHKYFQIRDYHLEVRHYFNPGMLHTGTYAAIYINANKYGIGLGAKKGWEGEGAGGAVKLGYVMPLGSGRWRLDFHVALGGYYTRFDPYVWGNPVTGTIDGKYYYDYTGVLSEFHRRSHRRWWFGPTEIGATLTFDLLFHRKAGGVSLRRKEVVRP